MEEIKEAENSLVDLGWAERIKKILYHNSDPYSNVNLLPLDLQGYNSQSKAFDILLELKPKLIIEVGSWKGASAIYMAKILKNIGHTDFEIVCVDTWLGSVEHWFDRVSHDLFKIDIYQQFLSNVIHEGLTDIITPFRIDSVNAAEYFRIIEAVPDFIYIDAGHDYLSVKNDLFLYSSLLKPGGHLVGDDWFHEPIKSAVYDTFEKNAIIELGVDKYLWIK